MADKRPTNAAQSMRIKEITKLLVRGRRRPFILEFANKNWGIAERTTDELISKASADILDANKSSAPMNLAIVSSNQWDLYRRAIVKKDLFLARQILMDIAKIQGLGQEQIHVIEDRRELADLPDDQLDKIISSDLQ